MRQGVICHIYTCLAVIICDEINWFGKRCRNLNEVPGPCFDLAQQPLVPAHPLGTCIALLDLKTVPACSSPEAGMQTVEEERQGRRLSGSEVQASVVANRSESSPLKRSEQGPSHTDLRTSTVAAGESESEDEQGLAPPIMSGKTATSQSGTQNRHVQLGNTPSADRSAEKSLQRPRRHPGLHYSFLERLKHDKTPGDMQTAPLHPSGTYSNPFDRQQPTSRASHSNDTTQGTGSHAYERGSAKHMQSDSDIDTGRRRKPLRSLSEGPHAGEGNNINTARIGKTFRPSGHRSDTNMTSGTSSRTRERWDRLKGRVHFKKSKKEKNKEMTEDITAYLMAGTLPAALAASAFLHDDKGKMHRLPVIFSLLSFEITPQAKDIKDARLHTQYTVSLKYGSGLSAKEWEITRDLEDFWRLNLALGIRRKLRLGKASKVPEFPSEALPFFRGARKINGRDSRNEKLAKEVGPGLAAGVGALAGSIGGATPMLNRDRRYAEIAGEKISLWLRKCLVAFTLKEECNRLCKFLEISTLGIRLAREEKVSGKEGYLAVRSVKGATRSFTCNPFEMKRRHQPRWFMVRESYIAIIANPAATAIYDVFYFDHSFEMTRRHFLNDISISREKDKETGHQHPQHHQFKLKNSERRVSLIARNERQLEQFVSSIEDLSDKTPWSKKHRFGSFAPVRTNVAAQWLVDGRDYFWNVSRAIYNAKDVIYIHDWWLSPELYLRRPPALSEKWRLDRLLQRKAQEGVKIFVIVYQNVGTTVPIDSTYTKYSLMGLHPNIMVQRSPGHLKQITFFWAHHEKILSIDNEVAFVGGLDLCFGRWDSPEHVLIDDKPSGRGTEGSEHEGPDEVHTSPSNTSNFPEDPEVWPGKDYSNPRVLDFHTLDKPYAELYDRSKIPRMAWHDISMCMLGQAARDVARHFIQRWNYLIRTKPPKRPVPMLLPPPDYLPADLEKHGLTGTCELQILRSSGHWSLGLDETECSIQNAYVALIRESEHFVYIENQFFITSTEVEGTQVVNGIGSALVERIIRAHKNKEMWKAIIVVPMMPGFPGSVDNSEGAALRLIMKCQFESISRGPKSIFGRLRNAGIDPAHYINFFGLRGWGKVGSKPKLLVSEMVYIHAKVIKMISFLYG